MSFMPRGISNFSFRVFNYFGGLPIKSKIVAAAKVAIGAAKAFIYGPRLAKAVWPYLNSSSAPQSRDLLRSQQAAARPAEAQRQKQEAAALAEEKSLRKLKEPPQEFLLEIQSTEQWSDEDVGKDVESLKQVFLHAVKLAPQETSWKINIASYSIPYDRHSRVKVCVHSKKAVEAVINELSSSFDHFVIGSLDFMGRGEWEQSLSFNLKEGSAVQSDNNSFASTLKKALDKDLDEKVTKVLEQLTAVQSFSRAKEWLIVVDEKINGRVVDLVIQKLPSYEVTYIPRRAYGCQECEGPFLKISKKPKTRKSQL